MRTRFQVAFFAAVPLVVGLILTAAAAQRPKPEPTRAFMQLKLDESQKLLAAIALEDFEEISRASQKISLLTEDENWQVIQTAEYRRHSDEFKRASNAATEAARKKNLDGAVLAYMQMTMQCVQCHQHVRKQK